MSIYQEVGARIRQYRDVAGFSQGELAKRVGTTANTVSRWESAVYKPTLDDLEKVAKALGLSLTDLLPHEKGKEPTALRSLLRVVRDLSRSDQEEVARFARYRLSIHRGKAH